MVTPNSRKKTRALPLPPIPDLAPNPNRVRETEKLVDTQPRDSAGRWTIKNEPVQRRTTGVGAPRKLHRLKRHPNRLMRVWDMLFNHFIHL